VPDLARLDDLRHRADGLLHRHGRIEAVQVPQVDVVDAESGQRRVDRRQRVPRTAVDLAWTVEPEAELGRQHDLVAAAGERPADELLVGAVAVDVGGVEERAAALDRGVHGGDRLRLVGTAVRVRHPHAAEAEAGHREVAEL
jgi:hypothetical protein